MAMEKGFVLSMLLEIYGGLLTEKQKNVLDLHINEDYSLSEIAETLGSTRQAALDAVKRATARLTAMERQLRLYERYVVTMEALAAIEQKAPQCGAETMRIRGVWEEQDGV